jgi:mxaJ protein
VAGGDIDVAIIWGPFAGYFGTRADLPLRIKPVSPEADGPFRFVYDIAIGVRRADKERQRILNGVLDVRRAEIAQILADYRVPVKPLRSE